MVNQPAPAVARSCRSAASSSAATCRPCCAWLSLTNLVVNGIESRNPKSTWTPRPATRSSCSSSIRLRSSRSASVSPGRAGSAFSGRAASAFPGWFTAPRLRFSGMRDGATRGARRRRDSSPAGSARAAARLLFSVVPPHTPWIELVSTAYGGSVSLDFTAARRPALAPATCRTAVQGERSERRAQGRRWHRRHVTTRRRGCPSQSSGPRISRPVLTWAQPGRAQPARPPALRLPAQARSNRRAATNPGKDVCAAAQGQEPPVRPDGAWANWRGLQGVGERSPAASRTVLIAGAANIFVGLIKLAAGILVGSSAVSSRPRIPPGHAASRRSC